MKNRKKYNKKEIKMKATSAEKSKHAIKCFACACIDQILLAVSG